MKKIALFTINAYSNYGNSLQNYAAQEYLKSLGLEVETVKNLTVYSKYSSRPSFLSRAKNMISMNPSTVYNKIKTKVLHRLNQSSTNYLERLRRDNFKIFTENYISETDYTITDLDIPNDLGTRYYYFITGSDQVWNPFFARTSEIDFLTFAPKNKRISLSASFGISNIPDNHRSRFIRWISEMEHISVREDAGAKIVTELTGKRAEVLVDPTMLLDKEQWLKIAKPAANKPVKSYILTYFLSGMTEEVNYQIKHLAKLNNLEIINLFDMKDKDSFIAGPCEFIDFVSGCAVFFTDSFHGAVFSILFEKPFIVYERITEIDSMFSRITTLLEKFNLNKRKVESVITNEDVFKVDFSLVSGILKEERKKAYDFLKRALEVED